MADSDRVTGAVSCSRCPWSVTYTGDSVLDVTTALHKLVLDHIEQVHTDVLTEGHGVTFNVTAKQQGAVTHFIRFDEPGRRFRKALCGLTVAGDSHRDDPTCPDCRLLLADEAEVGP